MGPEPLVDMDDTLPDYYRDLVADEGETNVSDDEADRASESGSSGATARDTSPPPYHADAFRIQRPSGAWTDEETLYTLMGPTLDGVTHNITIHTADSVEAATVDAFAARQIAGLRAELEACRILVDDPVALHCGVPAYRAIFVWQPQERRLYQEQIYVLQDGRGYTLTASFTRQTRKELGERVEAIMLGFTPVEESPSE